MCISYSDNRVEVTNQGSQPRDYMPEVRGPTSNQMSTLQNSNCRGYGTGSAREGNGVSIVKTPACRSNSDSTRIPSPTGRDDLVVTISSATGSPGTPKRWERTQSEVYLKGRALPMNIVESSSLFDDGMSSDSDDSLSDAGGKVSEHTKVYWDLPGAVEETAGSPMASSSRGTSGRAGGGNLKFTLQTIHQKEELTNDPFPSVGFGQYRPVKAPTAAASSSAKTSSYESSTAAGGYGSAAAHSTGGTIYSVYEQQSGPGTIRITKRQSSYEASYPPEELDIPPQSMLPSGNSLQMGFEVELLKLKESIDKLNSESALEQAGALDSILGYLKAAWTTPQYGRNLAYTLCDALRTEGGLRTIIDNCGSDIYEVLLGSARVLSQSLTSPNREYLITADRGLDIVVHMSKDHRCNAAMLAASTGILEGLFKHSENTCRRLVELGSLDLMSFSCRSMDQCTQRNCAMGLANLALYSSKENHEAMIAANIPEWLFPMVFSGDDVVRYYAAMAICALTVSREFAPLIERSGTMALVEPFILNHSPAAFARSAAVHFQGKADDWLRRLVPMLSSENRQSQSLAAFHFAMEAAVKNEQKNLKILYEVGAVGPLKEVAASPNKLASRFACEALKILGEQIPYTLSQHSPPLWSKLDVQNWLKQIGFEEFSDQFFKLNIDGDILLSLTNNQLRDDIGITNGIVRQRFWRRLTELKLHADYASCDTSKLCSWLVKVDPQLLQYAYKMLTAGVTIDTLPHLTEDHLKNDCEIGNGVHRLRIRQAAEGKIDLQHSFARSLDAVNSNTARPDKGLDVFISYRRSTGSQLASLLKVHLQLRGFTVFLDIEKLAAGRFDDSLLNSVKQAKHFILVLTRGSLDRCLNDTLNKDWVRREVVTAMNSECNIVPVMDDFDWPALHLLPMDMKGVTRFNGIRWIHDYQEACVDKLEHFLRSGHQDQCESMTSLARQISPGKSGKSATKEELTPHH